MHALPPAGVRRGVSHPRHAEDAGRPRHVDRGPVHGVPLLHGLVPVRHAEVRIPQRRAAHPEVRDVHRTAGGRGGDGLRGGESPPAGALTFGPRAELLEQAMQRIYSEPETYVHQVYGEHEVGGTGWLYLASVPFQQLGFRTDLGTTPFPTYTREFLYAVPVVLTVVPPFLLALSRASRARAAAEGEAGGGGGTGCRPSVSRAARGSGRSSADSGRSCCTSSSRRAG